MTVSASGIHGTVITKGSRSQDAAPPGTSASMSISGLGARDRQLCHKRRQGVPGQAVGSDDHELHPMRVPRRVYVW